MVIILIVVLINTLGGPVDHLMNTKFDDFWTCVTGMAFTLPIRLKRVDFSKYILGISVFSQLPLPISRSSTVEAWMVDSSYL